MEKKAVLSVLALLAFLRVAFTGTADRTCCHWWTESVEWPVGDSQCPATPDGTNNATYCCGLCYTSHHSTFEEAWLDWVACSEEGEPDWDACSDEGEPEPPVASMSSSNFGPSLALLIPGVLIFLFCAWMWAKEDCRTFARVSCLVGGSSLSFVRTQLRSRYVALFMADSQTSVIDTLEPRDSLSVSGVTNVQFFQSRGEEDDTSLPPVVFLPDPEEPASGGDPEEPAAPMDEATLTLRADLK